MSPSGKVLIIGDSISIDYTPRVAEELAGELRVAHNEGNAEDSRNLLANLDAYLAADAELVHFNCGLHDLKRLGGGAYQVPLAAYRGNLRRIVDRLRATGRKLIWATTTPVIDERHAARGVDFDRCQADVEAYNAAAMEVVVAANIPVNDLHAVAGHAGPERLLGPDGVHFTPAGCGVLAGAVVAAIRGRLGAGP